jgi:hypothetical protein
LALQNAAAQSTAARYFVTRSSHVNLHSGTEKIPVPYVVAPALAVE